MSLPVVRLVFAVTGVYDLVIGLVFFLFGRQIFDMAGVTHPNHWGYVDFGSLMLIIFSLMFFAVAAYPVANRNLIPYGILLKFSYISVVCLYWFKEDVPTLFKPFVFIDAVMLILFIMARRTLRL